MRSFQKKATMILFCLISARGFALTFDFNEGQKPQGWEEVGGTWTVKNGEYCGNEPAETEGATLFGEVTLTDVSLEAIARNVQGAWMALVVRWNDKDNQYGWWINLNGNTGEWWVKNKGQYAQDASGPLAVDRKQYKIKLVAKGDTFEGYYNDKLIATMKHSAFKTGRVGLLVWAGSACFDDVQIAGKDIPVGLAVRPQKTTATLRWGDLKTLP